MIDEVSMRSDAVVDPLSIEEIGVFFAPFGGIAETGIPGVTPPFRRHHYKSGTEVRGIASSMRPTQL
jgi:hypothetical protein